MLDRQQILDGGTLAPRLTPLVRIPPNGGERNQWIAKQVLDIGVFGIIFPHVSTVAEARNAVSACRYPRLPGAPLHDPPGLRGDAPMRAARYWGLSQHAWTRWAGAAYLGPPVPPGVTAHQAERRAIENLP